MAIQQLSDRDVVRQFVAHLAANGHPGLQVERVPEDEGGPDPPIDAVAGPFAIEHTSIDTVENQRRDADWFMRAAGELEAELRGPLPYRLGLTLPYSGVAKGQDWARIKSSLRDWIVNQSSALHEGAHCVQGVTGVPFEFKATRSSELRPGLRLGRSFPANNSLPQRLRTQLDRKAQKLAPFQSAGRTTVLLVESADIALMNQFLLIDAMRAAFSGQLPRGVDRIWYADTSIPADLEFHDTTSDITR